MAKIAPDKWKHFFVGIVMGTVLQSIITHFLPTHFLLSIIVTFALVVAISYGFELFSLVTKLGHYDIWDAVAGTAGGVAGMIIILFFEFYLLA